MYKQMQKALGRNFIITEKVDITSFFKTMMDTMTKSIEDSQLRIAENARVNSKKPIKEIIIEKA